MNRPFPDDGRWPHPRFDENRDKVPQEVLNRYENRFGAWNYEGTQIVAAADDHESLFAKLEELGIDTSRVVIEYLEVVE